MADTFPVNSIPGANSGGASSGTTAAAGGGDPTIGAIAAAIGDIFKTVNTALQPGVLSARAYFDQLLQARPSFQNPFAGVNESRKSTNTILSYAGVAVILMLILAIIVKSRQSK